VAVGHPQSLHLLQKLLQLLSVQRMRLKSLHYHDLALRRGYSVETRRYLQRLARGAQVEGVVVRGAHGTAAHGAAMAWLRRGQQRGRRVADDSDKEREL
jgi:hypothetical protein